MKLRFSNRENGLVYIKIYVVLDENIYCQLGKQSNNSITY